MVRWCSVRLSLVVPLLLFGACGSSAENPAWQAGGGYAGTGAEAGAAGTSASAGFAGTAGHTGGTGGASAGGAGGAGHAGASGAGGQPHGDPFEPAPAVVAVPASSVQQIKSKIDSALSSSSAPSSSQGVLVVDERSGAVLYQKNADKPLVPASNTKLFTSGTAFGKLGEDASFVTDVVAASAPDSSGVVHGDLTFVVHHDFSWSTFFYNKASDPLAELAHDLYDLGLRSVVGNVVLKGEALYEGDHFGSYDASAARSVAAQHLRSSLSAAGISSSGVKTSSSFVPPSGSTALLSWSSMPLSVTCYPLNNISHNEFADLLSHHLGYELSGTSTYAAGTQQTLAWVKSLGIDTTGAELHDGSGLSHSNHVTPRQIVGLLSAMDKREEGVAWEHTFSVAGVHGTLGGRMKGADTVGRFFGKTGTLTGVISTSGYLEHRYLGRRILISMIFNSVGSKTSARAAQNKVVEAVASDLIGKGAPPDTPTLQRVVSDGNGTTATVSWASVAGAEGYLVWLSDDGRVWPRSAVHYVKGVEKHVIGDLKPGQRLFVRVSARGSSGQESAPSDAYGVKVASHPSAVLVVDGNDRWQAQPAPENTLGGGHQFLVTTERAMNVDSYDAVANELVESGKVSLSGYRAVVWSLGEEGTDDRTFTHGEQQKLSGYLNGGGGLFVTGSEVGYDLAAGDDVADQSFYQDTLKASYKADDAGSFVVHGTGGVMKDIHRLRFYTPGEMVVNYPDKIAAAGGSAEVLRYASGGTAGVQYSANYRLVYFAFPFESIDNAKDRSDVMGAVMKFLIK